MKPAVSGLVTPPADAAMRRKALRHDELKTSRKILFFVLFRIECFLMTSGSIKVPLASFLYICRGMGAITD